MSDMVVGIGVQCERDDALRDVQDICREFGTPIKIRIRYESDVTRDKYGSMKNLPSEYKEFTIGVLPLIPSPNERQIHKAGLAGITEAADMICHTATKEWLDRKMTFDDIDPERTTVIVGKRQYRIENIGETDPFSDAMLYITLALKQV